MRKSIKEVIRGRNSKKDVSIVSKIGSVRSVRLSRNNVMESSRNSKHKVSRGQEISLVFIDDE